MRKAVLISLAFHALVTIVVFQWVSFRQVKYVPRAVYDVTLVTPAGAEPVKAVAPPRSEPVPEPVKEEKKDAELTTPPDKPKPLREKKVEKKEDKVVPTTQIQRADSLAGSSTDATAPGGTASGLSFDSGDFPYAYYVNRMRQKIAASWQVPAGIEGTERSAVIYFRAHPDGSVTHVAVEKTSGVFLFDQSCQRAVLQASPMPPLPREYKDEYLGVHFSFVFVPVQ